MQLEMLKNFPVTENIANAESLNLNAIKSITNSFQTITRLALAIL
jgi:hypothetical protein